MAAGKISESALDEEDRAFDLLNDADDVFSPTKFAQEKREREKADPFAAVRFADAAESSDKTGSCMAWKETKTSGDIDPGFRQGYGSFSLDMSPADPLYVVVGGQKSQSVNMGEGILDRLDIFTLNLKTGKWAMPTPNGGIPKRVGAAMAWRAAQEGIGGKLMVFGGASEDKATLFDDLNVLEVAVQGLQPTYTWKPAPMAEGPKPAGRQAASLVALADGSLVLHGGYSDAGPLADTWTLTLANDVWTWTEVEDAGSPSARKDGSLVEWPKCGETEGPSCVIAFGGNSGSAALSSVEVLKLGDKTWTEMSTSGDVPEAREGHSAFVVPGGDFMVIYGGCNMGANPQTCYNKVQALNLKTGEWSIVSFDGQMEVSPVGMQGAVFAPQYDNDAFFLYGGCDPFTSECQKRVISLRPKAVCPTGCENDGKYQFANGTCECAQGFKGDACEIKLPPLPCPADCSGHGTCEDGKCACTDSYSGADCSVFCPDDCSGHGTCGEKKVCECDDGFVGDNCADMTCPDDCMRHGDCDPKTGKCACFPGFVTENCGMADANCPNNCTAAEGRGQCVLDDATGKTKCTCSAQWGGADCNTDVRCAGGLSEAEACNGHGTCEAEKCKCDDGFDGDDCTKRTCPGNCGGKGKCDKETGECACEAGATGLDCSEKFNCDAVLGCSKNGICVADNKCKCNDGWEGEGCDKKSCPKGKAKGEGVEATECSNHGTCDFQTGRCSCQPTWGGKSCNTQCPDRCNGKGTCTTTADGTALCQCMPGFAGESCAKKESCPGADGEAGACNGRGTCFRGKCLCHPAFEGADCGAPASCPGNCGGNGECFNGKCQCAPGFAGKDCSESDACPGNCGGNGKCHGGKCVCDPGSTGPSCATPVPCPGNCGGNGLCVKGQCACETGYTGKDCMALDSVMLALLPKCPHKCSGNGVCRAGKCFCDPGFEGDDCGTKKKVHCPHKCSGHGTCRFGRCFCAPGWDGDDCGFEVPCPKNCSSQGRCSNGKCFCDPGFKGEDCATAYTCPLDCSDRGICVDGKCMCVAGFGGEDCSKATASFDFCPHSCSGHGQCEIGRCFCDPGWEGRGCGVASEAPCPDNCNGNGNCKHGQCFCDPGFEGDACEVTRECPEGCGDHGVCKYGRCYCAPGFKGENCTAVVTSEEEAELESASSVDTLAPDCPNACSLHGLCFDGKCHCEPGYAGEACEKVTVGHDQCPNDCRGATTDADEPQKGMCVLGKCFCYPGWAGDDCGLQVQTPCPSDCSGNGKCHYGRCSCDYAWEGRACDKPAAKCEDDCNQHGLCIEGKCECAKGWKGELCALETPVKCLNDCNGRGACVLGRCFCHDGFDGEDCSETLAGNHTYTTNPVEPDYEATLESLRDAVMEGEHKAGKDGENCTTCMKEKDAKGAKVTEQQWTPLETPEVADRRTPADMSAGDSAAVNDAEGTKDETLRTTPVEDGTAVADADMMRFRDGPACPSDCTNRGVCGADGACTCDPGFEGPGCEVESSCPEGCGAHGECKLGQCFCDPGFEGADCNVAVACENDCSGNGQCQLGKCFCDAGFEGADCAKSTPCPSDCNGNGKCNGGKCFCDVGFAGEDCSRTSASSCPSRCNGHGLCENGRCYCVQGYSGEDCQPISLVAASVQQSRPSVQPGWIGFAGGAVVLLLAGAAMVAVQRRRASSSRDQPLIAPEAPSVF